MHDVRGKIIVRRSGVPPAIDRSFTRERDRPRIAGEGGEGGKGSRQVSRTLSCLALRSRRDIPRVIRRFLREMRYFPVHRRRSQPHADYVKSARARANSALRFVVVVVATTSEESAGNAIAFDHRVRLFRRFRVHLSNFSSADSLLRTIVISLGIHRHARAHRTHAHAPHRASFVFFLGKRAHVLIVRADLPRARGRAA